MAGRSRHGIGGWTKGAVLPVVLSVGVLFVAGCRASDGPPSSDLLKKIQNAIRSPSPKIHRDAKEIPVVVFGNGAKVTIGMKEPMSVGPCVFISDPSDNLTFLGAADKTIYEGGRGAVVIRGNQVFLYRITVTDEQLTKKK